MLMLKLLVCKLSLFGWDDTKQAKSPIFIVVPQVEQIPKNIKKKKLNEMSDVINVFRTYNN